MGRPAAAPLSLRRVPRGGGREMDSSPRPSPRPWGGGVWGECAGENVPPVSLLLPRGALCSLESLAWEGDRVGHSVYCKWSGIPPALGKEFIESDPVTIESQGCPASVS